MGVGRDTINRVFTREWGDQGDQGDEGDEGADGQGE